MLYQTIQRALNRITFQNHSPEVVGVFEISVAWRNRLVKITHFLHQMIRQHEAAKTVATHDAIRRHQCILVESICQYPQRRWTELNIIVTDHSDVAGVVNEPVPTGGAANVLSEFTIMMLNAIRIGEIQ